MALDNDKVKTKTELFASQREEQVKQHIVYDLQDRPVFVFTMHISGVAGDPCSVTEYVYRNGTSTQVVARQERVGVWGATWDSAFTYDPTVTYDPDGDGVL
jgi:hypothetical protein